MRLNGRETVTECVLVVQPRLYKQHEASLLKCLTSKILTANFPASSDRI